jgi:hypothetical protein
VKQKRKKGKRKERGEEKGGTSGETEEGKEEREGKKGNQLKIEKYFLLFGYTFSIQFFRCVPQQ